MNTVVISQTKGFQLFLVANSCAAKQFKSLKRQKVVRQELRLANYQVDGEKKIGIVRKDRLWDISSVKEIRDIGKMQGITTIDQILSVPSLLETIQSIEKSTDFNSSEGYDIHAVKLSSPILSPEKIFLAAINYASHSKEQDVKPSKEPYFFTKFRNCIVGPDEAVILPKKSKQADWEVELAAIVGKQGKHIPRELALDHIAGFTIANDISFRDLQLPEGWPTKTSPLGQNWVKGKGLDSALPLGPYLVTKDEIKNFNNLSISLSVNGMLRQNSNTSEMVFKVDELIEYLSDGITLMPGDIISTGTPLGVAAFTGAPYLKDGDVIEAKIEGLGTLRNTAKNE